MESEKLRRKTERVAKKVFAVLGNDEEEKKLFKYCTVDDYPLAQVFEGNTEFFVCKMENKIIVDPFWELPL